MTAIGDGSLLGARGRSLGPYDAVVLAGGSGRRLGGADKALLDLGGEILLDRVLAAAAGADTVICVGPVRATAAAVTWCREDPPGGGPVAALAAAVPLLRADVVVVLAVDLPFVDRSTVTRLVAAVTGLDGSDLDGSVGLDDAGRAQPLLAAYCVTALRAALGRLGDPVGARMRDLVAGLRLGQVAVGRAGTDCDTAADLAAARRALDPSAPEREEQASSQSKNPVSKEHTVEHIG